MSEPVIRASLSSNYFLNCSNSNAVSKESSLKVLFGYFKIPFFSILKLLKANGFGELVTGFIAFSFTCGVGHCIEGWKPKLAGYLDCFDAAFVPVLFRFLYQKITIVS